MGCQLHSRAIIVFLPSRLSHLVLLRYHKISDFRIRACKCEQTVAIESANRGRLYFLVCVSIGSSELVHLLLIHVIMNFLIIVIHIMNLSSRMWQYGLTHPVLL